MEPPPAKKVRIDPDPKKPIIFATPGKQPDTLLRVFDQDFLVSSEVLRINSGFFRKFLEPSGGQPPASSEVYQYEWFTRIDEDDKRSWSLSSDSKFRDANPSTFNNSTQVQEQAFRKLLCAIFSRPYDISSCYELHVMTSHAGYYFSLPILSHSLWGPLVNSPNFIRTIAENPCHTLVAAYKLRHKQLFNDSFIQVLGPWKDSRFKQLKDLEPKLFQMAQAARDKMCNQLLKVQQGMFDIFADVEDNFKDTAKIMVSLADKALDKKHSVILPRYFRLCHDYDYKSKEGKAAVKKLLGPLLKKNLVLDKWKIGSGQGEFEDFFLSFQVLTYPWDDSQLDW